MDKIFSAQINYLDSLFKEYFHKNISRVGVPENLLSYLIGLDNNSGITPGELLSIIGNDAGRISRAVEKMVQLGLVKKSRSDKDKRTYSLQLTPMGKAVCAKVRAIMGEWEDSVMSGLSGAERDQFKAFLQKITDTAEENARNGSQKYDARNSFSLLAD